ncbi:MAG: hypothetical protein FWF47_06900 [Clostridia bacterium]|nr:hypothetical protein [Clostridia bacterium]
MKRNLKITLCCALVLCALSGCRLAKEDAGAQNSRDRLIGVYITTEYLDLFDYDGYLSDNLKRFQGGEVNIDGSATQKYQGRLYAVLTSRQLLDEETGETTLIQEYVFEGPEGIPYCVPLLQTAEEENSYIATPSDPAVSEGHTNIFIGEDEDSLAIDGTIYITPANQTHTYYFNPVYQCADGSVYAVAGNGFMVNNEAYSQGTVFSQTLDAATTKTENGKVKKDSVSIKVSLNVLFAPEKIVLVQMDADNTILLLTEYEPDKMPEAITPETGTAYIIAETHSRDGTGSIEIHRDIYNRDAEAIETFYARPDGVCVKLQIPIMAR